MNSKPDGALRNNSHWCAGEVAEATGGTWIVPPAPGWSAQGLCIHPTTFRPGDLVVVRPTREGARGVQSSALGSLLPDLSAIVAEDAPHDLARNVPVLMVRDSNEAILSMGRYARQRIMGKVLAVTGSAGKTTTVAMLAHALSAWGPAEGTAHSANLPHGASWNLASMSPEASFLVLELAIGKMGISARIAQPHVAVFTNIFPAHLKEKSTLRDIARTKSAIFSGMTRGGIAVLNRDMLEWEIIEAAARKRGLETLHYGRAPACHFQLLQYQPEKQEVVARLGKREARYAVGAPGEHMALNSLAVLAAIKGLGLPLEPAIAELQHFTALPGRGAEFKAVVEGKQLTVIDDAYNANPGSMTAALAQLRSRRVKGRKLAVLGEMAELGQGAADYHTDLADVAAASNIDLFFLLGNLYGDFWRRLPLSQRGSFATSLAELEGELLRQVKDGDVVLFKGSNKTRIHTLVELLRNKPRPGDEALRN